MTKHELIAILTKRIPFRKAPQRLAAGADLPADVAAQDQAPEWAKQWAAKLDAIAQGVARVLENQSEREATPQELDAALSEIEKLENEADGAAKSYEQASPLDHVKYYSEKG